MKRLEELGIGRPSTWASIIQTIQDRGYVWKKGQALVPTWTAFAVVGLLEQHFDDLVDYAFTARVETDLDAIAAGQQAKDRWLSAFYFGEDPERLERRRSRAGAAGPEAPRRGEPRPDRCRGDQHVPPRHRPRRQRHRGQAGQVRAVREARRRHGERARDDGARRADRRRRAAAARDAQVGRADRRARRPSGVRQERSLRAVRAVGHRRCAAAGTRQAEDGEPVQDDVARAHHRGRGRVVADAAAHARRRPRRRRADPRQQRPLRAVHPEGQGLPLPRQRGAPADGDAARGARPARPAQGVPSRRPEHGGEGSAARVRQRPGEPEARRRQGRTVRRLRHRRRDERVDRQGRPHRGDGARACVRVARGPPRAGRGQGWRAGQEALGGPQGTRQEDRQPRSRRPSARPDRAVTPSA